jgi:hypothetical protein
VFISFRRRKSPITLLGRSGCVYLTPASKGHIKHIKAGGAAFTSFWRRRVTQNTFRPVRLRLPHSGVTATKITSGPAGLYLSHSGVEGSPKTLLGRLGCVYLITASKSYQDHFWGGRDVSNSFRRRRVTQNTFRPVALRLPHSGVEGHQDHFWAGRVISFRCRKVTQTASGPAGRIKLIPASNVTQTTFRPVGLTSKITQTPFGSVEQRLPHSGV